MRWMGRTMKGILVGLIVCLSVVFTAQTAHAGELPDGVLAVDLDATGADDGTSWEDAYVDLQDALDDAGEPSSPITEIWVAAGQYRPNSADPEDRAATFTLVDGVAIYGGFAANETLLIQRDPLLNDTRLVGSYELGSAYRRYHVVTAINVAPPTRVDGFTIQNAQANGAGTDQDIGGGILIQDANPLIIRCTFWHNKAAKGGGIYFEPGVSDQLLEVLNCEFDDNASDGAPDNGGALYSEGGRVTFTNTFFHGNKVVKDGGAIYNDDGELTLYSCTLVGNHADQTDGEGGGIFTTGSSASATLTNCILWENVSDQVSIQEQQITGTATITYSCVEDEAEGGDVYPGEGNIDLDPLFVGPPPDWGSPGANARLTASSPCIDRGDNDAVEVDFRDINNDGNTSEYTPDLDLGDRIVSGSVDMGAYESVPCPWDLDGDCEVGVPDLLELILLWGTDPGGPPDFNGDGDVGVPDLLELILNWGPCQCDPGAEVLTLEEELADACLTMEDWDEFVDVMTDPESSQEDKDNYLCWMEHYLYDCTKCTCTHLPMCPGPDPFG